MVSVSAVQRYQLARQAGFSPQDAVTATAISLAEDNSGDPAALSPANRDGSHDLGLMQINSVHWPVFGGPSVLSQPLANMQAAFQIFKNRGQQFLDWTTFTGGAFRAHLAEARDAALQVESGAAGALPPTIGPTLDSTASPGAAPALSVGLPLAALASNVGEGLAQATSQGQALAAQPALNNLNKAVGQAAGALGGLTGAVGGFFGLLSGIIARLVSSAFWWRVGLVLLGAAAVLVGLVLYVKPPVSELVKAAAVAA